MLVMCMMHIAFIMFRYVPCSPDLCRTKVKMVRVLWRVSYVRRCLAGAIVKECLVGVDITLKGSGRLVKVHFAESDTGGRIFC